MTFNRLLKVVVGIFVLLGVLLAAQGLLKADERLVGIGIALVLMFGFLLGLLFVKRFF
jgi:hypothetical protein